MRSYHFILIILILTCGCDSSHKLEQHLHEYQKRMANVLEIESPVNQKVSLPPYPPVKGIKQNIPETTIKLFEFYNLKHCELYSLVAQRNTTLGNLQLPSTRYIYEKQLIDALEKCIIDTDDPKLKEKLTNWRTEKTTHFPLVWVDLIQLSSEMKYALSTNSGFVGGNEQDGLSQTKESLNYLLNINQNELATSTQLEKHLHRLINSPLPAKLWLSQKVITKNLYNSTKWLQQHTRDLQCSGSRSKNNMKYMTNVFQQFFIEKIQPIASQINHYQYQLGPIFQNYSSNPHLSSSFKEYIKQFNQQGFENYQREMSNHIQFWQVLFKRCNIKPGKP